MNKTSVQYISKFFEGVSFDVRCVIDEFTSGSSYKYKDFCKVWQEKKLLLALIDLKDNRTAEIGNLIIYFFSFYLRRGKDVRQKLCAVYALYSFVRTDQFLAYHEIRVPHTDVSKINELYDFLFEKKFYEAVYMLIYLRSKGHFTVTFTAYPVVLGSNLSDFLEVNEGDRSLESGLKRVYNILVNSFKRDEDLLCLECEYNLCKYQAMTGLSLPSCDAPVTNNMITRSFSKKAAEAAKVTTSYISSDDDFDASQFQIMDSSESEESKTIGNSFGLVNENDKNVNSQSYPTNPAQPRGVVTNQVERSVSIGPGEEPTVSQAGHMKQHEGLFLLDDNQNENFAIIGEGSVIAEARRMKPNEGDSSDMMGDDFTVNREGAGLPMGEYCSDSDQVLLTKTCSPGAEKSKNSSSKRITKADISFLKNFFYITDSI